MSSTPQLIKAWLSQPATKERIDQALMGWLPGDAFAEQCIMVARDPKLSRCTPDSLLAAFLKCAQIGLMPGAQKLVHLIARGQTVDVMITARGFKTLMERLPDVRRIKVELVHRLDDFERYDPGHDDGRPLHDYDPFDEERVFNGPDDLKGGYLQATFVQGDRDWFFVSAKTIDDCRRCAKSQNVWSKWFAAMALKTIYRQAWARMFLPQGGDVAIHQHLEQADRADRLALGEHYDHDADRVVAQSPGARALTYDAPGSPIEPDLDGPPHAAVGQGVVDAE